jgi:hypothetical protein
LSQKMDISACGSEVYSNGKNCVAIPQLYQG